ncbi:MAG: LCP family protein [Arachnia sp.]
MEPSPTRPGLLASILLTLASAIVPGSGLLGARRRGLRYLGAVAVVVPVAAIVFVLAQGSEIVRVGARWVASGGVLARVSAGLAVGTVVWVLLILVTHLATRPRRPSRSQRAVGAVAVVVSALLVAVPGALASRYAYDASALVHNVVKDASVVKASSRPTLAGPSDPWAGIPRLNVLLLGADTSKARLERDNQRGILTDTIMVASIDTATGDLALIQIPRNVQFVPFPEGSELAELFPDGYRGPGVSEEWFINTLWSKVESDYPHVLAGNTYRGAEALKQGVEGVTGLEIDYFVMLNLDGIQALIDAMGGVTVNINPVEGYPGLAIGGKTEPYVAPSGYLTPGPDQHLDGFNAMWYARSRSNTNDYDRMKRQSCLIKAIIDQANPQTLLARFEAVAAASGDMLVTDIPSQDLGPLVDLAFRVRDGKVRRLAFVNGVNYSYRNPDFTEMRDAVSKVISPRPTATATASATKGPSSARPSAAPPKGAEDVGDACAYTG